MGRGGGLCLPNLCRLSQRQVNDAQKGTAGQQLGKLGATGNATGPHLHVEMSPGHSRSNGDVAKPT
ncbi:peptidoglycan DD-metalloendopeptidase family protein [Streptomyces decoyicus]|uniref:peptidoglycan DD-metalloendopeptidase family protein n=1 Tax=Streptomyces decoyicus TaxID=249567 RepID=UPI0036454192